MKLLASPRFGFILAGALLAILFLAPRGEDTAEAAVCSGDQDCDAIPDSWEANAGSRAPGNLNIYAMGARKNHKDIFVELDYMRTVYRNATTCQMLDKFVKAFADAAVSNPDGQKGVRLHLDAGKDCGPNDYTRGGSNLAKPAGVLDPLVNFGAACDALPSDWYTQLLLAAFNANGARIAANRVGVFHHMYFAAQYWDCNHSSGIADFPGWHSIVSMGDFLDDDWWDLGDVQDAAMLYRWTVGTMVHEIGHNFKLSHDGNAVHGSDGDYPYQPNHLSVMSYAQQNGVWRKQGNSNLAYFSFDYQRFPIPGLNESSLNETVGLNKPSTNLYYVYHWCFGGQFNDVTSLGNAVDWNCDNDRTDVGFSWDINNISGSPGATRNEWAALDYSGGNTIGPAVFGPNARRNEDLRALVETEPIIHADPE